MAKANATPAAPASAATAPPAPPPSLRAKTAEAKGPVITTEHRNIVLYVVAFITFVIVVSLIAGEISRWRHSPAQSAPVQTTIAPAVTSNVVPVETCTSGLVMFGRPQADWYKDYLPANGDSTPFEVPCAGMHVRFTYMLGHADGGAEVHVTYEDPSIPECVYAVIAVPHCPYNGRIRSMHLHDTTGSAHTQLHAFELDPRT